MRETEAIIWIDAECTGTDHDSDQILEVAAVITDMSGENRSTPFQSLFSVASLSEAISNSDEKVQRMHEESQLWHDMWLGDSLLSNTEIESEMNRWMQGTVDSHVNLYFGGNSIILDRNFIRVNLPSVYDRISFRSVDVTTLSLALQSNFGIPRYEKEGRHRALPDVIDSIEEYKHYLKWLKKMNL